MSSQTEPENPTSIPTAKEKRAQLTDLPESVAHVLLVRVATAIREWTSGPKLVVEISRDEYEHANPVVTHLLSLGYLVTLNRAPRDRLGSPCLVVDVTKRGLFDDGGAAEDPKPVGMRGILGPHRAPAQDLKPDGGRDPIQSKKP